MSFEKHPILVNQNTSVKTSIPVKVREIGKHAPVIRYIPRQGGLKYIPEVQATPIHNEMIIINHEKADKEGMWKWKIHRNWEAHAEYKKIIDGFFQNYHEKKRWSELDRETYGFKGKRKHVYYNMDQICKEARERLSEIELDDFERIFRFRLQGKFRFYGIIYGNTFFSVWHDPTHKIYPVD